MEETMIGRQSDNLAGLGVTSRDMIGGLGQSSRMVLKNQGQVMSQTQPPGDVMSKFAPLSSENNTAKDPPTPNIIASNESGELGKRKQQSGQGAFRLKK